MKTLDDMLEDVVVDSPGLWENDTRGLGDWWAVSTGKLGIIAYFFRAEDAFRFRLDYINQSLNPIPNDNEPNGTEGNLTEDEIRRI